MGAERGEGGGYQRRVHGECWMEILRMLQQKTSPTEQSTRANAVEQFMGIECTAETKCIESESEPPTKSVEKFLQYSCYIDKDVKYLHTGLMSRLQENIEKHSPNLDRNAQYLKTMAVSRLPGYITIQMVRFHFKQSKNEGEAGVNAKVLKDVKFPVMLDMYDMCSPELKEKIKPRRTEFKEYEDWLVEQASTGVKGKVKTEALKKEREAQDAAEYEDWWFEDDDDDVSPIHEEDVLKLSGGGDWHTAYLLIYGPRKLPKQRGQKSEADTTPAAAGEEKMES